MLNRVFLCGRLTADPTVRYANDKAVANFNLAVDRRSKDDGADFPSCVAFGKTAEFIEKYVKKGTKLIIEGRLQTGSYTDKDGRKVYTTNVVADNVEFAESKGSANAQPSEESKEPDFMKVDESIDSELPFC